MNTGKNHSELHLQKNICKNIPSSFHYQQIMYLDREGSGSIISRLIISNAWNVHCIFHALMTTAPNISALSGIDDARKMIVVVVVVVVVGFV